MVVYPPNVRVPLKRYAIDAQKALFAQPSNSLERYGPWERCITRGVPSSMMPSAYNNGHQILQTSNYILFHSEMIHQARVIPLDRGTHPGPDIQSWNGNSVGSKVEVSHESSSHWWSCRSHCCARCGDGRAAWRESCSARAGEGMSI